ncbi:hypothetical protein Dda_8875 [Drechslerella dactyloides]|uniref:Nephrocystin 3-like N-terminal domain-containing protein n=1 Tax=Drechslerella dactyloides TaxID=74499 RepID=A0AAD6NFJ3_DREDA|nr:hypothetical protein Dda_8875 [Drechslerella dactyloides]
MPSDLNQTVCVKGLPDGIDFTVTAIKPSIPDERDPKRVALHNALLPNWQSSNSLRLDWDHQQARKKHVGNTGKWLLDSEQFQLWLSERNSFMWLHGIAGSGKTVMSAVEEEKRNVSRLLRSLLLQFCPAEGELPPKVEELHNRCLSQQLTFSEEFLLEVIEDLVKGERHTYIIVDALDECDASFQSGEESEAEKLVKLITRLTSVPELNVHLLVTSRDGGLTSVVDHELRRLAEESVGNGSFRHVIDLQAGEMSHRVHDDIKEFLCYELKRWNNRRGRLWLPLDEERRSLVADSIENRANGMHAREGVWLARQHAREIRISSMNRKMVEPPPNVDAIHEATTQPTELRDPANNSPARMCNSEFNNNSQSISEWAASTKLCLGQIVRGERTMHTDDDWQALASKGYEKFVDFMLSTTPSAISFHGASMLAILTSALARDYKRMALLIIDSTSKREESDTSGAYEMLDLAIKELEPEGFDPGVSHETIVGLILKHAVDLNLKGLKRWTGLHLAASQGDPIGRTALHVSSSQGHDLVTQLLLANGADNSLRDHAGWTALNHAVLEAAKSLNQSVPEPKMPLSKQERLVQTMRLLSDKHHRTDICNTETLEQTRENTLDGRGSTILGCMFHEIVIQNVATNTTVTAVFVQSFTLYRGSVRFRIPLIQHLLLNGGFGIDSLMMNRELRQNPWVIDSTSTYFENVNIYGGAVSFSFAKVKNLSVYGGSVTFSSPVLIGSVAIYGGSVTFSAAARIRQLFVYRGHANILGQSQIKSASLYDGFTNFRRSQVGSLHIYAGSVNFLSPAQINDLLIYGGVVNFTYETRRELMELLGELDVEDRLSCSDMVTQIGNLRIMDSGHFVFAVDGQIGQIKVDGGVASFHTGSTALQKAIKYGYQPIARLLLEKGANPNSFISPQSRTGKIWQTALHIAAFLGYEEMVQLLLEYGADTDLKNYQGQTAMQIAERQGNATIVQLLHEHKPNASGDWTGRGVQTTLHMVAERISNAVKAAPWHWIPGCA